MLTTNTGLEKLRSWKKNKEASGGIHGIKIQAHIFQKQLLEKNNIKNYNLFRQRNKRCGCGEAKVFNYFMVKINLLPLQIITSWSVVTSSHSVLHTTRYMGSKLTLTVVHATDCWCSLTHAQDRQTERQTDRQTDRQTVLFCSKHNSSKRTKYIRSSPPGRTIWETPTWREVKYKKMQWNWSELTAAAAAAAAAGCSGDVTLRQCGAVLIFLGILAFLDCMQFGGAKLNYARTLFSRRRPCYQADHAVESRSLIQRLNL